MYMKSLILIITLSTFTTLLGEGKPTCPLMLGDDVDVQETSTILGKKIEFCCGSCVTKFEENKAYYIRVSGALSKLFSDEEKQQLKVYDIQLLKQVRCPVYPDRLINPNSKYSIYKQKKVYFWSSSAKRRWDRSPDKYFEIATAKKLLPQFND